MPDDPTPLGDAMSHRFADQKIPQPRGREGGHASPVEPATSRPALPEHPKRMPADLGDEGEDRDGPPSLDQQKG